MLATAGAPSYPRPRIAGGPKNALHICCPRRLLLPSATDYIRRMCSQPVVRTVGSGERRGSRRTQSDASCSFLCGLRGLCVPCRCRDDVGRRTRLQRMARVRRRPRADPLLGPHADQPLERPEPRGRVDLRLRRDRRPADQPDRRRRRAVHDDAEAPGRRARRRDRRASAGRSTPASRAAGRTAASRTGRAATTRGSSPGRDRSSMRSTRAPGAPSPSSAATGVSICAKTSVAIPRPSRSG